MDMVGEGVAWADAADLADPVGAAEVLLHAVSARPATAVRLTAAMAVVRRVLVRVMMSDPP
jgi:hypothetical protein